MPEPKGTVPLAFKLDKDENARTVKGVQVLRAEINTLTKTQKDSAAVVNQLSNNYKSLSAQAVAARNEVLKGGQAVRDQISVLEKYKQKLAEVRTQQNVDGGVTSSREGISAVASAAGTGLRLAGAGPAAEVVSGFGSLAAAMGPVGVTVGLLTIGWTALNAVLEDGRKATVARIEAEKELSGVITSGTTAELQAAKERAGEEAKAAQFRLERAKAIQEDIEARFGSGQGNELDKFLLKLLNPEGYKEASDAVEQAQLEFNKASQQVALLTDQMRRGAGQAAALAEAEKSLESERAGVTGMFSQGQIEAFGKFQEDIAKIQANFAERRKALEGRIQQISIQAEAEIGKVREDAQGRELAAREEFAANEKKIADQQRRQQLRDQREHANTLSDAAARLDAVAFLQEQRNFADKQSQEKEDQEAERKQRQKDLQAKLALERKADEKRIQDIRARQSIEVKAAQAELKNLNTQLQSELRQREQAFRLQFNQLAGNLNNQLQIQGQGLGAMEQGLRAWYNRQISIVQSLSNTSKFGSVTSSTGHTGGGGYSGSYAVGGPIAQTGMALVHQGEEVLRSDIARSARSLMGGQIDQTALLGALKGGSRGPMTLQATLVLGDIGGYSEKKVQGMVERGLEKILRDYNEGRLS